MTGESGTWSAGGILVRYQTSRKMGKKISRRFSEPGGPAARSSSQTGFSFDSSWITAHPEAIWLSPCDRRWSWTVIKD
jgi:hypothetical protein